MSKKSEVMRVTKEEFRLVTLLREIDLDNLITEIDTSLKVQPSPTLQTLRSVLKSEFIPPFTSLSLSQQSTKLLKRALESDTPLLITGSNSSNKLTFLKSMVNEHKQYLPKVAVSDVTNSLVNSVCLLDSEVHDISSNKDSHVTLYNLIIEDISRLVVNQPQYIEDYLMLLSALQYDMSFIWVSEVHPLESAMLQANKKAYQMIQDKFVDRPYVHVKYLNEAGVDGFKIQVEEHNLHQPEPVSP